MRAWLRWTEANELQVAMVFDFHHEKSVKADQQSGIHTLLLAVTSWLAPFSPFDNLFSF